MRDVVRAWAGPLRLASATVMTATVMLTLPASRAAAHGSVPAEPASAAFLFSWSFEAHVWLSLGAAWLLYRLAVQRVSRAHPANQPPRWRSWCWYSGLAVLLIALASPIGVYDTALFSVHMVQHLLLTLVAPPLLALGAPITLLLRVSSPAMRRRFILPLLHSLPVRVLSFPVLTWVLFAGVMWASHFSPLFDAALESEPLHVVEHALYIGAGLLFWWPVVGADPSPWRLPHPARVAYLFVGMPQSSFLGLAIFSAPAPLYGHYATLGPPWGTAALADQQLAGGIMWAGGDLIFLLAMILAVWVWLRAEEAEGRRVDAQLDRQAAQRRREAETDGELQVVLEEASQ
jgi:cytochrome c oxidase assembly factor CtaG